MKNILSMSPEELSAALNMDVRYFQTVRFPGWTIKVHCLAEHRLMRRMFPELTKEEHLKLAESFAARRELTAQQHGNCYRRAVKKYGKPPTLISSLVSEVFPERVNNRLRLLAQQASRYNEASQAHWQASGKRSENQFKSGRVYVYTK